jgi:hypothetical protein
MWFLLVKIFFLLCLAALFGAALAWWWLRARRGEYSPDEIAQLIAFADEIPRQFPQLGEDGKPVAADVEFAFVDGKMWLLQIRPFNESRQARGAAHLAEMDKALAGNLARRVNLKEAVR